MPSPRRAMAATLATAALLTAPALARRAEAQATGTVQGTVSDSASRRGLGGVQVFIPGTQLGTVTNDVGVYTIRNVPAGTVTVSTQRIGFAPQSRRVTVAGGAAATADFVLRSLAVQLSQIVTIGYGTSSRQTVSSAIATVDSSTFASIPVAAVDNALQGRVPGVQVVQNSGEPGAGVSVRVRGPASLNAGNQPLYVVDGVPIVQGTFEQITSTSGQRMTPISGINPDDIEKIDVLKDAAATAIYGSRGSNGVILITTKRGAGTGSMRFGLSTYGGSQSAERKMALLDSRQYVELLNERNRNDGRALLSDTLTRVDTDWQDAIFRSAPISDAQLSMSGGGERVRAYISGANFLQKGIVIGSQYARQSARVNLDATANSKLAVSSSVSFTREVNNRVPGDLNVDGVVTNALAMQPFSPVTGSVFGFGGRPEGLIYSNPVAIAAYNKLTNTTLRGLGNVEARYTPVTRLTLTGRVAGDVYSLDELRWRSPKVDRAASAGVGGQGAAGHTVASRYVLEGFGNVDVLDDDRLGHLAVVGGSSVEYNRAELSYVAGQGFPTGFDTYIRNAAQAADYDGSLTRNTLVSFFGRANWSLKDRYLVSASLRTDGSSRFGSANRYGLFPAVSVGWTVSDEGFAEGLRRFATLKLRGSYGATGNQQQIGDFASRTLAAAAPYAGTAGLAGTQLGNPNLKWEQTKETDLGADLGLLDGRVSVIADWYSRNTNNLLVSRPVPATSGYTAVWDNVGGIRNRGLDLGLRTVNLREGAGRLGWTTDLNVTWNRNEVTELYDNQDITFTVSSRTTSVARVGQPLGAFYLFRFLRVDPQTGNALFAKADGSETLNPVSSDLQIVGNPQPKYYGGLTNTLTWGGFDLRGFLQFSQGGQVLNLMRIFMDDGGAVSDNKSANVLRRWQKPGDVTDVPRMSANSGARLLSSRFLEDGSFVRLGELTLGYRLPARLTRGIRLDNARVFASGRNLKTWTKYTGYNPDVNSGGGAGANVVTGVDYYAYPLARTFTFGVNAGW